MKTSLGDSFMRMILLFILPLILVPACLLNPALAQETIKVRTIGQAPASLPNAREAAVEDALRRAVEAAGVHVASLSQARDFKLVEDVIYTKTAGLVERYEVLEENPNQEGLYTVRVEATVSRNTDINTSIEAWKALIRRKGLPRVMVVGTVDGQPFDQRLTMVAQDILESRGLTVIDLARLDVNKMTEAYKAYKLDEDARRAALIAQETGADYLVVLSLQGERRTGQAYGVTVHGVDAVGMVKILRADTAQVLASKVIEKRGGSDTPERATRSVTQAVIVEAMYESLRRVASHWLTDVDQRGGQQVQIMLVNFSPERLGSLVANLRQVGGVKDVIVDALDRQGRSQVRVVTNSSAADLLFALQKLDRTLSGQTASKYQLTLSGDGSSGLASGGITISWWVLALAAGLGLLLLGGLVMVLVSRRK